MLFYFLCSLNIFSFYFLFLNFKYLYRKWWIGNKGKGVIFIIISENKKNKNRNICKHQTGSTFFKEWLKCIFVIVTLILFSMQVIIIVIYSFVAWLASLIYSSFKSPSLFDDWREKHVWMLIFKMSNLRVDSWDYYIFSDQMQNSRIADKRCTKLHRKFSKQNETLIAVFKWIPTIFHCLHWKMVLTSLSLSPNNWKIIPTSSLLYFPCNVITPSHDMSIPLLHLTVY